MKLTSLCILTIATVTFSKGDTDTLRCDFPKVDSSLNKVYNQVLTEYKTDTLFINRLKEAQRAWVKFRDAQLEARFPSVGKTKQNYDYGSIYPSCACDVLSVLTKERIKQLQEWLKGTIEGDGCAGSIKMK